jgi:preprotein translocase subunit YajC
MSRTSLLVLIVVLLSSAVGYLALDRHDQTQAKQHTEAFKSKYAR